MSLVIVLFLSTVIFLFLKSDSNKATPALSNVYIYICLLFLTYAFLYIKSGLLIDNIVGFVLKYNLPISVFILCISSISMY